MAIKNFFAQPPATHETRPEKREPRGGFLDDFVKGLGGLVMPALKAIRLGRRSFPTLVANNSDELANLDDDEIKVEAGRIGLRLSRLGFRPEIAARAFSLIREVAGRTLGMRHFDVQLLGGWAMLNGMVVEMETGEGKTLTATLTAATAALAGIPVHVISVNDYLTRRDAENMAPIYHALGLTVGCVTQEVEPQKRRAEYLADITYCTNNDVTFDYLRDKLVLRERLHPVRLHTDNLLGKGESSSQLALRGLLFAVVDEADSVFIDEARTPLVISGAKKGHDEEKFFEEALALAGELAEHEDFTLEISRNLVRFTQAGRRRLARLVEDMDELWLGKLRREEIVAQALTALHFFHLDEHYVVMEDKVQIVDEFTGRIMADRSWEQGLHQLIEVKEGCPVTEKRETMARISYQRFFRRYLLLAGMTGTAGEVRSEFWKTYGLTTVKIATNRPCRRQQLPGIILPTAGEKWRQVLETAGKLRGQGRPVLIGTRSVAASEHLGALFAEAGIDYRLLNAKQDGAEAEIVAGAGEPGRITIATNMAGRGTDIKLGEGVAGKGGLHVIITEIHDAARVDRQLAGRCARQGDPGSYQAILSLEDPMLDNVSVMLRSLAMRLYGLDRTIGRIFGRYLFARAQKKIERFHAGIRRELVKQDTRQGEMLSFSGRVE
jgi:preprotein translocase subunit SecA